MSPGRLKLSLTAATILVCLGGFFAFQNKAEAAINSQVNFQGKVTNTDGTNVSPAGNPYTFLFCIYTTPTPTTPCTAGANNDAVWRESKSITVTDGIFQTNLGDTTAFGSSVDFNSSGLYLGINFASNGQMTPLVRFTASPYAMQADKASNLLGGNSTTLLGSLPYQSDTNTTSMLAPNTSATKSFLTMTGTGTNGAAPTWGTISATDVGLGNVTNNAQLVASTSSTQSGYFGDLYLYDDGTPSNYLQITNSGNLTGAHVLNLNTNNVDRTISLSGDLTLANALTTAGNFGLTFTTTNTTNVTLPSGTVTLMANPMTTQGDIIYGGASGLPTRLAGATVNADVLKYNTASNTLYWATDQTGAGGGYATIYDDGNGTLNQETTLAFLGTGVTCVNGTSRTDCTINSGGAGPWTDGSGISYLTDTAEDFAIGASTLAAALSVDVSTNTTRIGSGSTANGKIDMYASDGDTGSITYNDDDTWAFEGGRVAIGANSISDGASSERMLQVGSEANRGNLAAYGEVISKGLTKHTSLANIKDVYVYDTTGDSDGGRWIDWATTDNLSWYSETLDDGPNNTCDMATEDRCYNNAFPRKAILVVTTEALYIFDAATNDMWMKFDQNTSASCSTGPCALGTNASNDPSSVTALNGVVYVGTNGSASAGVNGLYAIDFVNDRMWFYGGTNRSAANTGIAGRNSAVSYNVDPDAKLDISPVGTVAEWERVNDVHAVVMSRTQSAVTALGVAANTNPGYGKTFVALATDSGVTVINPSAKVLNQYSETTADDYTAVALTTRGFLYALNTTNDQLERWDTIDTDKVSEVNGNNSRKWDETIATGPALASSAFNIIAGAPDNLEVAERASNNLNTEDVVYVGHSLGMAELHEHTTQAYGWVKYYNDTRQTPMMMLAGINDMVLPMDDVSGTQAQDLAIANTDMAIKGAPTLGVNGVQGKAINFDNTDDYLCSDANQDNTCDLDTAFNMSTVGWTISLWFRHSATAPASGADTIFEKCVDAVPSKGTGCVIAYMATNGTIVVANDTDATWTRPDEGAAAYNITSTSTYAYNDNQWHNLVITRTSANDVDSWIDGQGMNLSTATGGTTTFDDSQIVTIGASCVLTVTANCAAVTNVWDGQIDDVQYIVGTTTQATMTQLYVRRYYNVERPRASKRVVSVDNATSATSTSLADTGEAWYVNELAGSIVEIMGSDDTDCVGITRRISSNTATSLTFTPAVPGSCTLDTSADFQVDPESLYGASSAVAGIGITAETPLGEARQLCVGTNGTTDTGGVTCYNHQDGPSIVADVYHSQASQIDDNNTDWAGTDHDDMRAIDLSTRTLVMASEAQFTSVTEDVRLGQGLDYISNQLYAIRQEIVLDGITAVGSTGSEVGFTGGADLAEYYKSPEPLEAGMIVATGNEGADSVKKTSGKYQKDVLGIVATAPGIILGTHEENSYPVALTGRVPMNITTENGMIMKGDQVTSSSLPGYGMVAIETGRVIGTVLEDPNMETFTDCPVEAGLPIGIKCGQVMVFVSLTDFTGVKIEDLMTKQSYDASLANPDFAKLLGSLTGEEMLDSENNPIIRSEWTDIFKATSTLGFMKKINDPASGMKLDSEILAKNVNAVGSVVSPLIVTDTLIAKNIKAENIEGLQFIQTGIADAQSGVEQNTTQVKNIGDELASLKAQLLTVTSSQSSAVTAGTFKEMETQGSLKVGGPAEFQGLAVFKAMAQFIDKVVFKNDVEFAGQVMFNSDTAGYATVKEGADNVVVKFAKEYAEVPVVNASLSLQQIEEAELRKATEDLLLVSDVKFIITNVTTKGFEIRINREMESDIPFSWTAIAVKDAKTFEEGEQSFDPTDRTDGTDGEADIPIVLPAPVVPTEAATPETTNGAAVSIAETTNPSDGSAAAVD